MTKRSATQKLCQKKTEKKVRLESGFAGIKAGEMMFVATPLIVDAYIRKIPEGQHRTVPGMRKELARRNHCAASCPVSTSIFVRIAAEAALEQIEEGKPISQVTPFWRILRAEDKITARLSIDPEWVTTQRRLEGIDGE